MKATISIITIVVLLSRSFNSTYASDRNDAIIAVGIGITVLSGIGFIYSVIYDIRQAPESARKYKESLYSSYPLKSDRPQVTGKMFGKPQFSRNALVNRFSPVVLSNSYATEFREQDKSPQSALFWSLGATLIPVSIGFGGLAISDSNVKSRVTILGLSSGLIIGPSTGHWYAQQYSRGFKSLALRAGFATLGIVSFYLTLASAAPFGD